MDELTHEQEDLMLEQGRERDHERRKIRNLSIGCPINFGDCPDCEFYKEMECQWTEEEVKANRTKRPLLFNTRWNAP